MDLRAAAPALSVLLLLGCGNRPNAAETRDSATQSGTSGTNVNSAAAPLASPDEATSLTKTIAPAPRALEHVDLHLFATAQGPDGPASSYHSYPDLALVVDGEPYVIRGTEVYHAENAGKLGYPERGGDALENALHAGAGGAPRYFQPTAILDLRGRFGAGAMVRLHTYFSSPMERFSSNVDEWVHVGMGGFGIPNLEAGNDQPLTPWSRGRDLGLSGGKLMVVDAVATGPERERDLPTLEPAPPGCARSTHLAPLDLAATGAGEVWVVGTECGKDGAFALEHFGAGQAKGTFIALPALPDLREPSALMVRASQAGQAALAIASAGAQYVVFMSEATPRIFRVPEGPPIRDVSLSPDGSFWLLQRDVAGDHGAQMLQSPKSAKHAVLRLAADGTWADAAITDPEKRDVVLTGLAAMGRDQAIIAGGLTSGPGSRFVFEDGSPVDNFLTDRPVKLQVGDWSAIWTTSPQDPFPKADAPPAPAPDSQDAVAEPPGPHQATNYSTHCKAPFVVLFQVSDAAPDNYDYPITRDALKNALFRKSMTFVEYNEDHHRRLGARVKSLGDAELLMAHLKKTAGMSPALVCYAPEKILRRVEF